MRTFDQFADEWRQLGPAEFSILYGKPALIGIGMIGQVTRDRQRSRSGTFDNIPPAGHAVPEGETLIGRIWMIGKTGTGAIGLDVTLGRGARNDVILSEYSISRRQVAFRCTGTSTVLIDLRSRNGTFINDQRVEPGKEVLLHNGDALRLGRFVCTFLTRKGFLECVANLGCSLSRP